MTAQIPETLHYQGERLALFDEPLRAYFQLPGVSSLFVAESTANWRGYEGTWEIRDDRLYLTGLEGRLKDGSTGTLATVFPDSPNGVFARWYSGELHTPRGRLIKYVHMGYASQYESDLLLQIENGVLKRSSIRHNGVKESDDQ